LRRCRRCSHERPHCRSAARISPRILSRPFNNKIPNSFESPFTATSPSSTTSFAVRVQHIISLGSNIRQTEASAHLEEELGILRDEGLIDRSNFVRNVTAVDWDAATTGSRSGLYRLASGCERMSCSVRRLIRGCLSSGLHSHRKSSQKSDGRKEIWIEQGWGRIRNMRAALSVLTLPSESVRNQLVDLYFNQIVHP
jgi:hypothetical protein